MSQANDKERGTIVLVLKHETIMDAIRPALEKLLGDSIPEDARLYSLEGDSPRPWLARIRLDSAGYRSDVSDPVYTEDD